jgi:hypothetical protein
VTDRQGVLAAAGSANEDRLGRSVYGCSAEQPIGPRRPTPRKLAAALPLSTCGAISSVRFADSRLLVAFLRIPATLPNIGAFASKAAPPARTLPMLSIDAIWCAEAVDGVCREHSTRQTMPAEPSRGRAGTEEMEECAEVWPAEVWRRGWRGRCAGAAERRDPDVEGLSESLSLSRSEKSLRPVWRS